MILSISQVQYFHLIFLNLLKLQQLALISKSIKIYMLIKVNNRLIHYLILSADIVYIIQLMLIQLMIMPLLIQLIKLSVMIK